MDNSNVGSNSPKSCTNLADKFPSIISSSSTFSITKSLSASVFITVELIFSVILKLSSFLDFGSKLSSEAFEIVGFNDSLLISKIEGFNSILEMASSSSLIIKSFSIEELFSIILFEVSLVLFFSSINSS